MKNCIYFLAIVAITIFHFSMAQAVTTAINVDSTLGANQTINNAGGVYAITEANGKPDAQSGNTNLFFSFSTFNVGAGNTASFDLTNSWSNVVTRVTGGAASTIDGTLKVNTALGGWADNFFFINPSGITFGPGSVVDVPGSFYASTASILNFKDGTSFRADGTQPSGLSAADPVSFGFLGNETGALNLNNTRIQLFDDTRLELVGHDININTSTLGQVNLVANGYSPYHIDGIQMLLLATHSQTAGTVDLDGQKATIPLNGDINIANTTLLNAGGDAEEIQFVRGGNISLSNAHIISDNYGDDCGGFCSSSDPLNIPLSGIDITATGKLTLDNVSSIESETSFNPVGNINIQAQSLLLDNNSKITTSSINSTHINYLPAGTIPVPNPINPLAGNINIMVANDFVAKGGSSILSSTETFGNAGHINITAGSVALDNASIKSESTSNSNSLLGYNTDSNGNILYTANTLDFTNLYSSSNQLVTATHNVGDAGQITLNTTSSIALVNNSLISTNIQSGTQASELGKIALNAQAGAITLDGSTVSSTTSGDANAGDIVLTASDPLQLSNNAKITTDSSGAKLGNSGAIAVTAKALTMNTGVISSSSKSLGSAGQITVNTPDGIALSNSSISTDVQNGTQSSQTGKIALNAQAGAITLDGSTVSSTTSGDANAGDINLVASGLLQMSNGSKITTDSLGDSSKLGNSGVISIASKDLTMNTGSLISSSTNSLGNAGTVTINTGLLNIQGLGAIPISQLGHYVEPNFTGIRSTANAGSGGQTGFIDILARNNMMLTNGAQISISNKANVTNPSSLVPTHINIVTPSLTMTNSQIVADSSGNVDAGDINITFTDTLYMDPSAISTLANNGNGGNIVINGGNMFWLQDSAITTSVLGLQGNGGNIDIKSDYLIMDSGFIQANTAAQGASGGTVNINVNTLIPSGSLLFVGGNSPFRFQPYSGINVIQAAAPNGVKGQINSTSPQLNLSGTLANLILQSFDQNVLSRDLCAIGDSSSLSQSGKGGLRRRAKDPLLSNAF
ncbi:MAG: filamentous hemagglutinin N-terminal domain-containing protein [Methylococcales bacterium]